MSQPFDQKMAGLRRESEEREAKRRAEAAGLNYVDLRKAAVDLRALGAVAEAEARAACVALLQEKNKQALLAVFDSKVEAVKEIIQKLEAQGWSVTVEVASLSGLEHVWESYKYVAKPAPQVTGALTIEAGRVKELENVKGHLDRAAEAIHAFDFKNGKIEDLLEIILVSATLHRASDIHFEPEEKTVRIRYRIDGLLHDVAMDFPRELYHYLIARVKLLSKLKINVENEPQDGRFTIKFPEGKETEARVSVIPSEFGETAVLRLLYAAALELSLEDLGLRADDLEIIKEELKRPDGMILNTGPTGSGKTTTLYVFLRQKAKPEVKIITIEKPIEYHVPGIEQTQVDEKHGYDFAAALKSILRQDPDVILIGEINDIKTADAATQAALTGHLVFSTVHANNAPAAVPRLLELEVKPAAIGPALNLVIAQRLVRRLCNVCRAPQKVDAALESKIKKFTADLPARARAAVPKSAELYAAHGCAECGGFGYKGRVGIFELFLVGDEAEKIISESAGEAELQKLARRQGMVTMQEDGILKALHGITTFEEVEAATGPLKL